MKSLKNLHLSFVLIMPVLAMLFGASAVWSQEIQVYQSWKLSTSDGKLLFMNFDPTAAFPVVVDNGGYFDERDNDDRVPDFVDISYLSSGLDLLAIEGETELWIYFGGAYRAKPSEGPDNREVPQMILEADQIGLRNLVTVAGDPDSSPTEPRALLVGQSKGKPVFRAFLCAFESDYSLKSCTALADEFPRPVASGHIPDDATGALAGGGWVLTGGTEVVFIKPDGTTITAVSKQGVLNGGERITDVAYFSGNELLLATDDRRVLQVDAVAGGGNTATPFPMVSPKDPADPCLALRDQRITVDVTEDQGQTLVMVGDFACSEATLYTSAGATTVGLGSSMPVSGTVTEGQFLDLTECLQSNEGCIFDNEGNAPVTIQAVQGNSAATRYLAEGMFDCRCKERDDGIDGICPGDVGPGTPVNWLEFLPDEIHNLVADPSWIPAYLEGSPERKCAIKAYIVIKDPNTFTGTLEGAWDIGGIFDDDRPTQCVTGIPRSDTPVINDIVGPAWDVVIYAPTSGKSVCPNCDPDTLEPEIGEFPSGVESMLASVSCGSTVFRTRSKSIFGVGFTVVPIEPSTPGVGVTDQLITDLGTAIFELALPLIASPDEQALLTSRYGQITTKWETAKSKLVSQPNAADTNLSALTAQLRNLREENARVTYAVNPDNIQGDVETRIDVLLFWIDERLRQLIPLGGF